MFSCRATVNCKCNQGLMRCVDARVLIAGLLQVLRYVKEFQALVAGSHIVHILLERL